MIPIFDQLRDINLITVLVRLFTAVILGGVIGLERSYKNRPAGFRTHILVCIGATIASMTGIYLFVNMALPTDISRLGAQVVSGLGFIGGGTIIVVNNNKIKGLTTAAGLWACGIIGLATGAGFYEGAILATALVLIAETVFAALGRKIPHSISYDILLYYNENTALNDVMRYCKNERMIISNLQVKSNIDDTDAKYAVILSVRTRRSFKLEDLIV